MRKKIIILLCIFTMLLAGCGAEKKSDLKFIFVHGLSGWGSYDTLDHFFPYWGLSGGSVIKYLNRNGYDSYAASVAPSGSAWDRACELYAQLAGTVVDYGKEHSERCNHPRFGTDFSGKPLIDDLEHSKLVLLGHSFGGATVRLFSEILANGAPAEQDATDISDLSPFFAGGQGHLLHAIVALAAPNNGTTAYDMYEDPSFDASQVPVDEKYVKRGNLMSRGTKAKEDTRIKEDYAAYDMHIDNALAMNEGITTFDHVYYFSYPCSTSVRGEDGAIHPDADITESLFMRSALIMSAYEGTTAGGVAIDASWQSNDGLVNEVSAKAPLNAPSQNYDENTETVPGIWNIMPTLQGDHMCLQGGLTKRVKIKPLYLRLVQLLSELPVCE